MTKYTVEQLTDPTRQWDQQRAFYQQVRADAGAEVQSYRAKTPPAPPDKWFTPDEVTFEVAPPCFYTQVAHRIRFSRTLPDVVLPTIARYFYHLRETGRHPRGVSREKFTLICDALEHSFKCGNVHLTSTDVSEENMMCVLDKRVMKHALEDATAWQALQQGDMVDELLTQLESLCADDAVRAKVKQWCLGMTGGE